MPSYIVQSGPGLLLLLTNRFEKIYADENDYSSGSDCIFLEFLKLGINLTSIHSHTWQEGYGTRSHQNILGGR